MTQTTTIKVPFDPASIEVERKNMSVSTIIEMLQNDMFDLTPAFQRSSDLWSKAKQSQLIESLLLKLPLPNMYWEYDNQRKKYIVIDGLQRLCALRNFASGDLQLEGLEFLEEQFGGATYGTLDFTDRLMMGLEQVEVNIFKGSTPYNVKQIIFKRLNSGGLKLERHEIRNALKQGEGTKLLERLSTLSIFKLANFSTKRMADRDTILRVLAFATLGTGQYNGRMETFLDDALDRLNNMDSNRREELEGMFEIAMERLYKLTDGKMFTKITGVKRAPSKSLFEALCLSLAALDDNQFLKLLDRREIFIHNLLELRKTDDHFNKAIGNASDRKEMPAYRHYCISNLIHSTISR